MLIDMKDDSLLSPETNTPIGELRRGEELDKWTSEVLKTELKPYSTSWQAVGEGIEKIFEVFGDSITLCAVRYIKTFDKGKGEMVELPCAKEMWTFWWNNHVLSQAELPTVAFAKGVIQMAHAKERLEKKVN